MERKKHLSLLMLVLLCTCSQIFAATTYYEVWRSETNNPATADRIAQWLTVTYYNDTDPLLEAGQPYYYWIRALSCEYEEEARAGSFNYLCGKLICPVKATEGFLSPVKVQIIASDNRFNIGSSERIDCSIIDDDPIVNDTIYSWDEFATGPEDDLYCNEVELKDIDLDQDDNPVSEIFLKAELMGSLLFLNTTPINVTIRSVAETDSGPTWDYISKGDYADKIYLSWDSTLNVCSEINFNTPSAEGWKTPPLLSPPSLSSPSNGSTVNGTEIIFQWSSSSGATNYHIQIATDSSFNNEFLAYDSDVGNSTSFQGTGFPDNGMRFHWRVKAGNSSGWSGYPSAWYFDNGTALLPDLIITDLYPNPTPLANTFYVDQSVDWYVTVRNNGGGSAEPSYVGYYLGDSPSDLSNRINRDILDVILNSGESDTEDDPYIFTAADVGTKYLICKADYDNKVDETDENNNTWVYGPFTVVNVGSLTVNITPQQAIDASAQWQLTSGPDTGWKNSGETINNIPIGSYTLQFEDIPGFEEPIANTVEIYQGTNTEPGIYSSIYSGGTGIENDPFVIASAHDLLDMSENPASYDKNFILSENIDLADYIFNNSLIWDFLGVFEGNGKKISNLIINLNLMNGLFGSISQGGEVNNLGIENCLVSGVISAGGLVADNYGSINNCYVTGHVNSMFGLGGDLVGINIGIVNNCYANCSVSGLDVAGLVGSNHSSISNCYAAGMVYGNGNLGGLVVVNEGTISNSFWDTETSGITGAAGLTTSQMQDIATYVNAGWDFNDLDGDPADWKIRDSFGYPLLSWQEYLIGDFAGDYSVNLIDFSVFAASWMSQFGDSDFNVDCDLDNSGDSNEVIYMADLMVFCDNWLEGASSVIDTNDGLITYYKFDGTSGAVIDETGTNNGVNDSATRDVVGKVGNAFYFDGSNSWVESDFDAGITGNSDWTISFWMYTDNPKDTSNLISLGTYGYHYQNKITGIGPGQTNTQLFVNLWETPQYNGATGNEHFYVGVDLTGAWNHIAATYNGKNLVFFVNGEFTKAKAVTLDLADDKIRIGGRPGGYDEYYNLYFDGMIDEVRIYNRTFSASEVQYLFQHP